MTTATREGLLYAIGAYGLWGIVPLYFKPLADAVRPEEVLAHRVLWSLVCLLPILWLASRWGALRVCLREPTTFALLAVSAVLIAANWYVYVLCVTRNIIVHASLGYLLTPLVNVLLDRVFFGRRLRALQLVAAAVATAGVVTMIVAAGEFPWLGLVIACSFGFYSLVRKTTPVDGLVGLSVETLVLTPIALGYLIWLGQAGTLAFGTQTRGLDILIACSGPVTAAPLLCFGQAARRLSLTALGFFQYLAPSLQFVIAVTVYGEDFRPARVASFSVIWAAVALFAYDSWRAYRQGQREQDVVPEM